MREEALRTLEMAYDGNQESQNVSKLHPQLCNQNNTDCALVCVLGESSALYKRIHHHSHSLKWVVISHFDR